MPILPKALDLAQLNEKLSTWIDRYYHVTEHGGIKDQPLKRYLKQLHLIRSAPSDLKGYFRLTAKRAVNNDRSVSFGGRLFEAPVGLIGKSVPLRFHRNEPETIEVFYQEKSYGYLIPVDPNINYRIGRYEAAPKETRQQNMADVENDSSSEEQQQYRGGSLFGRKKEEEEDGHVKV